MARTGTPTSRSPQVRTTHVSSFTRLPARAFRPPAVPCREAFLCALQACVQRVPSRREAGPHRLLGVELRRLARARLPRGPAAAALARALRDALRHGRGQRDLLPAAEARDGRALGRGDARGLQLRDQGEPLPDPHQAPARDAPSTCRGCSSGSSRCSARRRWGRCCGSSRRASTATTSAWQRRWRRSGPAATRSSSAIRAGSAPRCSSCCASTASALVIGDHPERPVPVARADRRLDLRPPALRRPRPPRQLLGRRARDVAAADRRLARRREVFVYANNDWEKFAVRNAGWLRDHLTSND